MSDLTMYKPQNNGPHTTLAAVINASQTSITVEDSSVLPTDLPNVLTIGTEEDAELVKVTSISGNILAVERGYNNTTAKQWDAGAWIYRAITAQDLAALQGRVENTITTMTAEAFEALTTQEKAALYANGVRQIIAGGYGYVLDAEGGATPIRDPNAVQRGETVEKAKDSQKLGGKPASDYFLTKDAESITGAKLKLKWQNASPQSEYPNTTENVTFEEGKLYLFVFGSPFSSSWGNSVIAKVGSNFDVVGWLAYNETTRLARTMRRTLNVTSSGFNLTGCVMADNYGGTLATQGNSYMVPLFVYEL